MWNIEGVVKKGDYLYAIVKDHPRSIKHGYVLHHIVVMENHLKRTLDADECVHHKNGNKKDNRIENLEVMKKGEHSSYHGKIKGRKFVELLCPNCKILFHRAKRNTHIQKGGRATFCSRKCSGTFNSSIKSTCEVEAAISGNIVREYTKYEHDNPEETE